METTKLRTDIEAVWDDRSLLGTERSQAAIRQVIELLDKGRLRTAEPLDDGT